MLMCDETATLIRTVYDTAHDVESYACTILSGISWYGKARVVKDENGRRAASEYWIRIPEKTAIRAGIEPKRGDYLVLGAVESITSMEEIAQHSGFVAHTVGDNRRGKLPHWVVSGE